ncbi:hypothetical protein [Candidatus Frankia alpina]|uniref:hypothetical protein n=1 Tax=Candidatus Frankia alpina TaxID=2699483 RepID=UPI0013D3A8E6|nr:hypothetical protein [Candidatus Frankia alpina]
MRLRDGRPDLDLEYLQRACRRVIADRNVRAAVDLVYLTDQNPDRVAFSLDTYELVLRVEDEFRPELRHMDCPQAQRRNLIEPLSLSR